jgi:hypothetical protein
MILRHGTTIVVSASSSDLIWEGMTQKLERCVYSDRRRWHYSLLRRYEGRRTVAAMAIYDSRTDRRDGFASADEALAAASKKRTELLVDHSLIGA